MRTRSRHSALAAGGLLLAVCLLTVPCALRGGEPGAGLELRQILPPNHDGLESLAAAGTAIPQDAMRVFVHEGAPLGVHVTEEHIAVGYRCSGVLFDRATGAAGRRLTVADRWPEVRPRAFGQPPPRWPRRTLVGPGVNNVPTRARGASKSAAVASATFAGRTWEARQPLGFLSVLLRDLDLKQRREQFGAWTPILRRLHDVSYVRQASLPGGGPYYPREDRAGPSVEHLVAVGGKLFVGGPGGLFVGPGQWTQLAAHPVLHLAASEDGKALDVECKDPARKTRGSVLRGRYDPADGRLALEQVFPKEHFFDRATLLAPPGNARWTGTWVRVPIPRPGHWVVGPLGERGIAR